MPERAAEPMLASDDTSSQDTRGQSAGPQDAREKLLADAAALLSHENLGADFLAAYYRLVAPEDLTAAGPERLAMTAAHHAALGATRPQGRPIVSVRPADGASLTGAGTVVDLVTDDMPYLVDSVTMALNRHAADVRLNVHPMLAVRRDVAGASHRLAPGSAPAARGGPPARPRPPPPPAPPPPAARSPSRGSMSS